MPVKTMFILYGVILAAGAFMGYKAGSKISLIAGLSSAAIVFLGVYLTSQNSRLGFGILTGISGALCVMFLIRFLKTHAFMPSGMILILSLVAVILGIIQLTAK